MYDVVEFFDLSSILTASVDFENGVELPRAYRILEYAIFLTHNIIL